MIKPHSSQKTYDVFFTGDSAIVSLPKEASDQQKAAHEKSIERALKTGDWSEIVLAGEMPTRFVLRPLGAEVAGELYSMLATERHFSVFSLAFKLSLVDVKNLPDAGEIDWGNHRLGRIATTDFLDRAGLKGELGAVVIMEIGAYVLKRARGDDPL